MTSIFPYSGTREKEKVIVEGRQIGDIHVRQRYIQLRPSRLLSIGVERYHRHGWAGIGQHPQVSSWTHSEFVKLILGLLKVTRQLVKGSFQRGMRQFHYGRVRKHIPADVQKQV